VAYSNLFIKALKLLWNNKYLLVLGLFGSIGKSIGSIFQIWIVGRLPTLESLVSQPGALAYQIENLVSRPLAWFMWRGVNLFFLSIAFWLIVTLAEGALINAVANIESGHRIVSHQAIRSGWKFLGRFVGIDTLIFFPLFLTFLILMFLIFGFLGGSAVYTFKGASFESVVSLLAFGLVCLIPLFCLLFPISFLTAVFRTLAFRDTVIRDAGVRDSIHHTWRIIRQHTGKLFILVALLWGAGYLINLILTICAVPLIGVTVLAIPINGSSIALSWIINAAVILVSIGVHSIMYSFISVIWTLAYAGFVPCSQ